MSNDMVARSRLEAVEAELAAAEAKLAKVQNDAGAELDLLQSKLDMVHRAVKECSEALDVYEGVSLDYYLLMMGASDDVRRVIHNIVATPAAEERKPRREDHRCGSDDGMICEDCSPSRFVEGQSAEAAKFKAGWRSGSASDPAVKLALAQDRAAAEIERLQSKLSMSETAVAECHAETARLRGILARHHAICPYGIDTSLEAAQ